MAVVFKSYEIVLIRVFLHAEFISAPKTEIKSMVFEKYAKNGKTKYLLSLFSIFGDFCIKVSIKNSKYQLNHVS